MNNCPKCGNPLQVGTSSCPICGTDISAASAQPTKTTVTVASVATPTTPPVNQPAPVVEQSQPAPTTQPVVATEPVTTAPVTEAPTQPTPSVSVEPTTQPVQQVAPTPVTEPVTTPIDPNAIAPTVKSIDAGTPVPSIPASLNPDANLSVSAPVEESKKVKKAKKGINKNVLVILLVVLVAAGIGAFLLMGGTGKKTTLTPAPVTEEIAYTSVSTNGYKLKLQDGWIVTEDGDNVIITNSEETVALKLAHSDFSVSSITKETIESYFATRSDFTNTEILETTISAKEGYLVNTTMVEAPIQVYFIGGGNNLTIGATIVYVSAETKTKYEAAVTEMIGSLSYSDESLKAISTIDMFNGAFGVYNGIIAQTQTTQQSTDNTPLTPETPNVEDTNANQQQTPSTEQPSTEVEQNTGTNTDTTTPETPVTE